MMEDIPQPASNPYTEGQRVRVYLAPDDTDNCFHGVTCVIVNRFEDNLDTQTGRELDRFSYRLRAVNGDTLPIQFRHSDLVPSTRN